MQAAIGFCIDRNDGTSVSVKMVTICFAPAEMLTHCPWAGSQMQWLLIFLCWQCETAEDGNRWRSMLGLSVGWIIGVGNVGQCDDQMSMDNMTITGDRLLGDVIAY